MDHNGTLHNAYTLIHCMSLSFIGTCKGECVSIFGKAGRRNIVTRLATLLYLASPVIILMSACSPSEQSEQTADVSLPLSGIPLNPHLVHSTLIVDEIPGRFVGNDDEPPGRVFHMSAEGDTLLDISSLKMPYDAVPLEDGSYLVNIIRARAVWRVTPDGEVLWEVKVGGYPCSLQLLPNGHLLVAGWDDDMPGFVREFDADGNQVWQIENLRWPWKAERLDNGNTLIADAGTNRVFEVDAVGVEVWAVEDLGPETPALFDSLGPVYCQRLDDGHTLVSIRGLSKVVELDRDGHVVWEVGSELVLNQYSAVRLPNGNTLIADQGHFRVIEIDKEKEIVWELGGFGYPAKAYRY